MKLKYFAYLAERSFQTSPNGERLFVHVDGFWSNPYIIPDEETEKRLFKKQLWMWRIFLGTLILGQPFLFSALPNFVYAPLWFIGDLLAVLALFYFASWLIFRKELQTLKRSKARIPFLSHYRDMAQRFSILGLLLGFLGSLAFVWIGSWIIQERLAVFIGWFSIIFFGLCAIAWGYILYLKLTTPKDKEVDDNGTEA